jgi:hypothetical protein
MTCNAIYRQKARIKSKILVAPTVSQPVVYAKGLRTTILMPTLSQGLTAYAIWVPLTQKWIICPCPDRRKSKKDINDHMKTQQTNNYFRIYTVNQEECAILWEMIVCVILSKIVHMNMGPILNLILHRGWWRHLRKFVVRCARHRRARVLSIADHQ